MPMNFIHLYRQGLPQTIEATQGSHNYSVDLLLDEDVQDDVVKAEVKLPSGSYVSVYCNVNGNKVSFLMPLNITAESGEYQGQIVVTSEADSDYEDLLLWKQKVESGQTVVLVESTDAEQPVTEPVGSQSTMRSFPFTIKVTKSIRAIDDPYQSTLEQMQQAIQDANAQLEIMEAATTNANSAASNANSKASACETAKTECVSATSDCTEITETAQVYVPQAQQIVETWQNIDVADAVVNGSKSTGSFFSGTTSCGGVELKKIIGKTVQNGTPSPDSPVEIENVKITEITSHGKNLIAFPYLFGDVGEKKTINGVTAISQPDGSIKITGTATSNAFINLCNIKFGNEGFNSEYSSSVNGYIATLINESGLKLTYDKNNNVTYILINSGGTVDDVLYPMIEKSEVRTEWEAPTGYNTVETNLKLAEGDTYENNKVARKMNKITLLTEMSWTINNQQYDVLQFSASLSPRFPQANGTLHKDNGVIYSNIGTSIQVGSNNQIEGVWIYENNTVCVCINRSRLSEVSVEAFKTWLQSNPVIVEYELETPTVEDFNIPTIPSYEDYTYISTDSEVEPTITFRPLPFTECIGRLQELYDWYLKVIAGQTSVLIDTEEGS